jgi:hypothetical protein
LCPSCLSKEDDMSLTRQIHCFNEWCASLNQPWQAVCEGWKGVGLNRHTSDLSWEKRRLYSAPKPACVRLDNNVSVCMNIWQDMLTLSRKKRRLRVLSEEAVNKYITADRVQGKGVNIKWKRIDDRRREDEKRRGRRSGSMKRESRHCQHFPLLSKLIIVMEVWQTVTTTTWKQNMLNKNIPMWDCSSCCNSETRR